MNRKITRFTLGAWCGVCAAPTCASEFETRPAKAIIPKPPPMRLRASRRVSGDDIGPLFDIQKVAGTDQHFQVAAPRRHGKELSFFGFLVGAWSDSRHHAVSGGRWFRGCRRLVLVFRSG